MRNDGPHIEIDHSDNHHGAQAVASTYDMDSGPLKMPNHIRIGAKGSKCGAKEDYILHCYDDQVDEYDIWLEKQVKIGNPAVLNAIDDIYNTAERSGIILKTRCVPSPYRTHAHVVKQLILKLAG